MENNAHNVDSINIKSLKVLSHALEISFWTNRKSNLPSNFQLEFDWTDLYFEPVNKLEAPKSGILIDFANPKSVSFLHRKKIEDKIEFLLEKEAFALDCKEKHFTFTDNELKKKIISEMETINTIHGYSPTEKAFLQEKYSLVFIAEDYGFAISAEAIKLYSNSVEVELNKIPELNELWINYWTTYCKLMDTDTPLPKDESFERRYYYGT
jgi:hypothetical protein